MKKSIVIIVSAMNLGGAQRVVSILCDHWSQNGCEVTLISTYTGEKANHYQVHDNVSLRYLSDSPYFNQNKIANLIWKLFQLRKIVKSLNPDQVISFLTRVNVASALSLLGIKSSLTICERTWTPFATLNKKLFWFYRILFKKVDRVIVQTDKSKYWLRENFPNIKVQVIANPTIYPIPYQNEKSIKPDNLLSQSRKIILASGRLHKFKQFDLLINTFSSLEGDFPDWDLVILGDGEERKDLSSDIFNLTKDTVTVKEVAELCKKYNPKVTLRETNDEIPNMGFSLSNKKILKTGFRFLYELEESIKEMILKIISTTLFIQYLLFFKYFC